MGGVVMKFYTNHKHLLIYDRLWWIQGQRALLIQKHHPNLEIMSFVDFMNLIHHKGANQIKKEYEFVSILGLCSAEPLLHLNVHVLSSFVVSYIYVAKNKVNSREWSNKMRHNYKYMKHLI